ncbi:helix-turn-helix domain-containing protein [Streptomyces sp. 6N223]|uniref:helix-turn-helix domain-containing protein n=1 Tax=Streptomyces sp. 6N223 TaxID=3457412 RepID=UPI003FD23911
MSADASDNDLGAFIRARREAVTPAEVGLPTGGRRRTPGLRRSELATVAGISVEYLTRLEQGRDRHPSLQVLGALAEALRLTVDEFVYLRRLAKDVNEAACCQGAPPPARELRPTVRALLEGMEPSPAVLVNRLSEVLAHTAAYERLVRPSGLLDGESPNLLRYHFTDPRARAARPDWEHAADRLVAHLKIHAYRDDPHIVALTEELTAAAGTPFARRLAEVAGPPRLNGVERLAHPEAGELRLAYETLELPDTGDQRIVVYLPADEATSAALDRVTGRQPGALRAVAG